MEKLRQYWAAVKQRKALPAWLLLAIDVASRIWKPIEWAVNELGNWDTLKQHRDWLTAMWQFITSPLGHLTVVLGAVAWLVGLALLSKPTFPRQFGLEFRLIDGFGCLWVSNPPSGQTIKGVRAEYVKIDPPPYDHLILPAALRGVHGSLDKPSEEIEFDLPPGRSRSLLVSDGIRLHSGHGFGVALLKQPTTVRIDVTGQGVSPARIEFTIPVAPKAVQAAPAPPAATSAAKPLVQSPNHPVIIGLKQVQQGLVATATNPTSEVLRSVHLDFIGMRRFSDTHKKFVLDPQCETNGTFPSVELGSCDLHSEATAEFGFASATDPSKLQCTSVTIRTAGIWRAEFRLNHGNQKHIASTCFEWKPGTKPIPYVPCPAEKP